MSAVRWEVGSMVDAVVLDGAGRRRSPADAARLQRWSELGVDPRSLRRQLHLGLSDEQSKIAERLLS